MRSLVKQINLFKAGYSYAGSRVRGNTFIPGMPVSISTELTNHCNLRCPQCVAGSGRMTRERGFMDVELFNRVMMECGPYLFNLNLYFQGEPMLHPDFFSFLENCQETNITVSTNGHFLNAESAERMVRSKLSRLIVSLDGIDQETYSLYRVNGNINIVIEGLKQMSLAKRKFNSQLIIELQFLVNKFNEHQIPLARELARLTGSSLSLKSMQILDGEEADSWMPTRKNFRRYRLHAGSYVVKSSLPDRCSRLWFNPVITWDGLVIPCCFDKNSEYVMGDLKISSFREIWNGTEYRNFRKSILTGRYRIDICRNCTSGLRGVKI